MIKEFFDWNIMICDRIERRLPRHFTRSLQYRHELIVADLMKTENIKIATDLGCGKQCGFSKYRNLESNITIVGVDINESDVRGNGDIDCGIVTDLRCELPLKNASIDLVTTRSVIEHLENVKNFIRETSRILRHGGRCVHVFPCRYSPFSLINRIMPNKYSRSILFYFFPKWRDSCGHRAYYDNCYYVGIRKLMASSNLNIDKIEFRYYQSIYYKFFIPFYLISLVYDLFVWRLGIRTLASQILVVTIKNDQEKMVKASQESRRR
jgi:SAM-dependent methyltransferase